MVILCKNCRYTLSETNKIGFAFLNFMWISRHFLSHWTDLQKTKKLSIVTGSLGSQPCRCDLQSCPCRWGEARRRWGRAGLGKQMALGCDLAHPEAIGGGCMARGGSGERRQWGRGGAPAGAQVPVRFGAGKIKSRPWELEGDMGKG
jgi:hypothetical protein